jgi:hypothetical protein
MMDKYIYKGLWVTGLGGFFCPKLLPIEIFSFTFKCFWRNQKFPLLLKKEL